MLEDGKSQRADNSVDGEERKKQILHHLHQLKNRGVEIEQRYSMQSEIEELEFILESARRKERYGVLLREISEFDTLGYRCPFEEPSQESEEDLKHWIRVCRTQEIEKRFFAAFSNGAATRRCERT